MVWKGREFEQVNKGVPKIFELVLSLFLPVRDRDSLLANYEFLFYEQLEKKGYLPACGWYLGHMLKTAPRYILNSIYWGGVMFKNYLKVAIRNLVLNKIFSFINISGLAIGIATCMLITFWVQNELSYDSFHKNSDRIFRIEREIFRDELFSRWPISSGQYKDALLEDFPEIENAVRFWGRAFSIKDYNNTEHRQGMYAVDNSIFQIFDFELLEGDEKSALTEPNSLVMTRDNAMKYFGTYDVVGKTLAIDFHNETRDFKITGIIGDVPENSHIDFNMLMSISTYPVSRFGNWRSNYLYTYILLKENVSRENFELKLKLFIEKRLETHYSDLTVQGLNIHEVLKVFAFPLTQIHLNPAENWELRPGGNMASVYLFSSIAVLILVIAAINFMNLSTARANKRAKEVSLRKTVGASVAQLKYQFLQESIMLACLALMFAVLLLLLLIPVYNDMFSANIDTKLLLNGSNIIILIGVAISVGLFSGIYPAFYLTSFEPAIVLKGQLKSGNKKSNFRRNLVVFQFAISVTLIIGMFTVYSQMEYVQNKSLGFEKENIMVISARGNALTKKYESFRNVLLMDNSVRAVGGSADLPGDPLYSNGSVFNRELSDDPINMIFFNTNYDFIDTYNIELVAGRNFSRQFATDTTHTLIINEAAASRMGWKPEEAVGKTIDRGNPEIKNRIIGVVKDFNYKSLRREIEPMIMQLDSYYVMALSVRINAEDISSTIERIEKKWTETFPNTVFQYSFLNDRLVSLYEGERKVQSILIAFSFLSILIACLGLFGLASYTTEEKTKEIGIRKTLGATIPNIFRHFTKVFTKWVMFGTVISWPISYFLMENWLQNFAYRIELSWVLFLGASVISLLIAVLTVGVQVIRAAKQNPVDSLKYE